MALRFAVASQDLGRHFKRAIAAAARSGVPGVRLNARTEVHAEEFTESALRQLLLTIQRAQMQVAGLMFSTKHSLHDPEFFDQRIDGLRRAMPLARKLATEDMIVRVGRIPDPEGTNAGEDSSSETNQDVDSLSNPFSFSVAGTGERSIDEAEQFRQLVELLNDLISWGNHVGCRLQLQLASYNVPHIRRLMSELKAGPVGLVFDSATCVMTGASPVQVYRDIHDLVGYVRCRDALKDIDGAGIESSVGHGIVDWTELFATIAESDFPGWCCIERTGGDDRSTDVMAGVRYVRDLLPGAVGFNS